MLTLGIDPGTATTGFGLITEKNRKLAFLDHGVISTSRKDSSQDRLKVIYQGIKGLLAQYKPKVVSVEKIFFGKNTKTAIAVGQARGIVLLTAAEMGVPVAEYTPLQVKLAITGYGKADKKQVQAMVKILLELPFVPKPDDAADALAIAICHLHSYKMAGL